MINTCDFGMDNHEAVGARCFINFDHHTQKREGGAGAVSAIFFYVFDLSFL